MKFADLLMSSAFEYPEHLSDVASWHGHIPFAFWCVDVVRPRIFVELGTHKGDSYCAFCQFIDRLGLSSTCYAIDTWTGDEHAGLYGDEVYKTLQSYHDKRYGAFSRLVRSTFDEAVGYFSDGSIDLLHIDGLHTYEAVKHDFETWCPKLSDHAVVLLHDINVRERDFGVWRLWEQLCKQYPHFSFLHSHGLGMLAVGHKPLPAIDWLCNLSERESKQARSIFMRLGQTVSATPDYNAQAPQTVRLKSILDEYKGHLSQLEAELAAIKQAMIERDSRIEALAEALGQRDSRIEALVETVGQRDSRIEALVETVGQRDSRIEALVETVGQHDSRIEALVETVGQHDSRIEALVETVGQRDSRFSQLKDKMAVFYRSRSWQITRLLRAVIMKVRQAKDADLRRCLASFLQLFLPGTLRSRLRFWRQTDFLRRCGLFDAVFYCQQNPDVAASFIDPIEHYLRFGWREGRNPHPLFDTTWYLDHNPDVAAAGLNPLVHYIEYGAREGRRPHPNYSTGKEGTASYIPDHGLADPRQHSLRTISHTDYDPVRQTEYPLIRALAATGVYNGFWYGGEDLRGSSASRFKRDLDPAEILVGRVEAADTETIIRYSGASSAPESGDYSTLVPHGGAPSNLVRELAPLDEIESDLANVKPIPKQRAGDRPPSFSIVTPFFLHGQHFQSCALSVFELMSRSQPFPFEWVVVNDDPTFSVRDLERAIPERLRQVTHILSDGRNAGIVRRLNEAIDAARNEWLVFLDCDDLIHIDALWVLHSYIVRFPYCRYISSTMIDIAENGDILRYRRRMTGPANLLRDGMTAGHLKAIRRDAFEDYGLLEQAFNGCQDYEFALRMASKEPLLYIPEYLYFYRWHANSQSVSRGQHQSAVADHIVQQYAQRLLLRPLDAGLCRIDPLSCNSYPGSDEQLSEHTVAIVRTQGRRNDLLQEALWSLSVQRVPVKALVVVHGPEDVHDEVARAVSHFAAVEVLHAPDVKRRRGYPINVALAYLYEETTDSPGFLFFLDDDDIVYPAFTMKMHEALIMSGADIVYAVANRRIPWQPAQPAYVPLPAPCLLIRNFIPINSYAVRFASLARKRLLFSEKLEYLEDWDFLVRALGHGLRFFPIADTLSEYRVIGDGNTEEKTHPELWAQCDQLIREEIARASRSLGKLRLNEALLTFPIEALASLRDNERKVISATRSLIDKIG